MWKRGRRVAPGGAVKMKDPRKRSRGAEGASRGEGGEQFGQRGPERAARVEAAKGTSDTDPSPPGVPRSRPACPQPHAGARLRGSLAVPRARAPGTWSPREAERGSPLGGGPPTRQPRPRRYLLRFRGFPPTWADAASSR